MNKLEIKYRTIKVPKEIKIDDKIYPTTKHNYNIVKNYEETKDKSVLDKLSEVVLDFN